MCILISSKVEIFIICKLQNLLPKCTHMLTPWNVCYLLLHINQLSIVTLLHWYISIAMIPMNCGSCLLIHRHSLCSGKSTGTMQPQKHGRLVAISSIALQCTNDKYFNIGEGGVAHNGRKVDTFDTFLLPQFHTKLLSQTYIYIHTRHTLIVSGWEAMCSTVPGVGPGLVRSALPASDSPARVVPEVLLVRCNGAVPRSIGPRYELGKIY